MAVLTNIADGQVFIGASKTLAFTVRNEVDVVQNIGGWTLRWELRRAVSESGTALITKSTPTQIAIPVGTDGVANVALTVADTASLLPGVYHHALSRTGSGVESVLSYGYIVVGKAATP